MISIDPALPIAAHRDELVELCKRHQVIVVAGETGSGKSTQLPKIALMAGLGAKQMIGHTQPRRIAARSVAERIAEELGTTIGEQVGYAVRFTDRVSAQTQIKVMTDGILLAEIQRDPKLSAYDCLIIDEAHERSLNIDFLLGYLHQLLPKRPDLKVIITSATIDTEKFSTHFGGAPVVSVSGRTYPVEVRYRPIESIEHDEYTGPICDAVKELLADTTGDLLVFCSGEREIRDTIDALGDLRLRNCELLPLFARLSAADQHRVFERHSGRRIVVSTNVAETSVTVPGITGVVDTGLARISRYSTRTKVQRLPIEPIAQASAQQRSGRCGRVAAGVAIRLFSEEDFESRPLFTEPEIRRTNLASVILQMANLRLGSPVAFPFVDPPERKALVDGVMLLVELGAIKNRPGQTIDLERPVRLTEIGRRMARLPIDPRMARMILEADRLGCVADVIAIAAGLSIQDPRERPLGKEAAAAAAHAPLVDPDSDLLTLLHLWDRIGELQAHTTSSQFRKQCRQQYLHYLRIREWQDLVAQLRRSAKSIRIDTTTSSDSSPAIHQALLAGLVTQVGRRSTTGTGYVGPRGIAFDVGRSSTRHGRPTEWVMAAELIETNRLWAHAVAPIRPEWIEDAAPHLVERSHSDPWWDRRSGTAMVAERVILYGLVLAADRAIPLRQIDSHAAREMFLQHALVDGDWNSTHRFIAHNDAVLIEARDIQARARRVDALMHEDELAAWFAERVPETVTGEAEFNAWWRKARRGNPELLNYTIADVCRPDRMANADEFPETWRAHEIEFPIFYDFAPGSDVDGATVQIPIGALHQLSDDEFDWGIPGHRRELIDALLRSLPKPIRRELVPIPESAEAISQTVGPTRAGSLLEQLATAAAALAGVPVAPDDFAIESVDAHLRLRFEIVNGDTVLATGTSVDALRALLASHIESELRERVETDLATGQRTWTFGDLPTVVEEDGLGYVFRAYPALVDEGATVGVTMAPSRSAQHEQTWGGVRRLLRCALPDPGKRLVDGLSSEARLALVTSPYATAQDWVDDVVMCTLDELIGELDALPHTEAQWETALDAVRKRFARTVLQLGDRAGALLAQAGRTQRAISTIHAPSLRYARQDVTNHCDRLYYAGVLSAVGAPKVDDLTRYLQAIEIRVEQLFADPDRDAKRMRRCAAFEAEADQLASAPVDPNRVADFDRAIADVTWLLEEFRVSVFAQELSGPGLASERRLREAMSAARACTATR